MAPSCPPLSGSLHTSAALSHPELLGVPRMRRGSRTHEFAPIAPWPSREGGAQAAPQVGAGLRAPGPLGRSCPQPLLCLVSLVRPSSASALTCLPHQMGEDPPPARAVRVASSFVSPTGCTLERQQVFPGHPPCPLDPDPRGLLPPSPPPGCPSTDLFKALSRKQVRPRWASVAASS